MAVESVAFLRVEYREGLKQEDASGVIFRNQWGFDREQVTSEVLKKIFENLRDKYQERYTTHTSVEGAGQFCNPALQR